MLNPVFMIAYNNLELTKASVDSVLQQDIPVELILVNNGSTDGTREWMDTLQLKNLHPIHYRKNMSPCFLTNGIFKSLFMESTHVLGLPNDVRLPPNCYSEMLRWPRGFVSASDNGHNEPIIRAASPVSQNTPMAVMMTRKWAYDAILSIYGHFFDERFWMYASDCDLALRMTACGIHGVQLDIPFWHYGSASWRLAPEEESVAMRKQADNDRAYFFRKWGFGVADEAYGETARDLSFRGERVDGGLEVDLAAEKARSKQTIAGAAELRAVLTPLYNGLRHIFGEFDALGVEGQPSVNVPSRTAAVWEDWKRKLGGQAAKAIDALLLHGEMTQTQLRIYVGCARGSTASIVFQLNKASLINKNGGKISLKEL